MESMDNFRERFEALEQLTHTGRIRRWKASSSCGLYLTTHRLMVE
jgi:hypothetical protein